MVSVAAGVAFVPETVLDAVRSRFVAGSVGYGYCFLLGVGQGAKEEKGEEGEPRGEGEGHDLF